MGVALRAARATATCESSLTTAAAVDDQSAAPTPSGAIPVQALSPSGCTPASTEGDVVHGRPDGHPATPHSPAGERDGSPKPLNARDQVTSVAQPLELAPGIPPSACRGLSEAPKGSSHSSTPARSCGLHPVRPSARFISDFPSATAAAAEGGDGVRDRGETGQDDESNGESLLGTNSDAYWGGALHASAPALPPSQPPPEVSQQRTLVYVTPKATSTAAGAEHQPAAKTTQELVPAFSGGTRKHSPPSTSVSPSPRARGVPQAALSETGEAHEAVLAESYAQSGEKAQRLLQQALAEPPRASRAPTRTECGHGLITAPGRMVDASLAAVGSAGARPPETAAKLCGSSGAAGQSQNVRQQASWTETPVSPEHLSRPDAEAASPFSPPAPLAASAAHAGPPAPLAPLSSSPAEAPSAAAIGVESASAAVGVHSAVRHAAAPTPVKSVDMQQQTVTTRKHSLPLLCCVNEGPAKDSPPEQQQQQRRKAMEHRIAQLEAALFLQRQTEQRHLRDVEEVPADYFEIAMDGDEACLGVTVVRNVKRRSRGYQRYRPQGGGCHGGGDGVEGRGAAAFDERGRGASSQAQGSVRSVPAPQDSRLPVPASAIHWAAAFRDSGRSRDTESGRACGSLRGSEAMPAGPAPGASSASYTQLADRRYGWAATPAVVAPTDPRYSRATTSFLIGADWRYQRIYVDTMYFPKAGVDSASQGAEAAHNSHEEGSGQVGVACSAPEALARSESPSAAPTAAVWCASLANSLSADVFPCRSLH
ncbi:hypothetical protein LSCM1_04837 [Leishmania martiniquensis]|uniref:Uncharacterized protein n=1 Tax=Leishmania martiniquensis TaxID=1580590 RepID=A0A836HUT1_9TRYP|nr:hypothetical protein LSCM1_04837 [Leishmania martiniquensis]